jgi:hypothetical protein
MPGAGGSILNLLAGYLVDQQAYKTLVDLMLVTADGQVGAAPGGSGTTSLAMKGLVPALLGFAVEHGAIARDVKGTVATFRASPAGIVKALQGKGLLDIYEDYSTHRGFNIASRFSVSASFDTARTSTPNTVLGNSQQLSAWSVRAVLLDHRDPRAKRYAQEWRAAGLTSVEYQRAREALSKALAGWSGFTTWQSALVKRVEVEVDDPFAKDDDRNAAAARFRAILAQELPKLKALDAPDAQVSSAMSLYVAQLTGVVKARNDVYAYAREGSVATFDWTTTRDRVLPDLYTLTGVFTTSFMASRKDDFTANAAVSFYREAPAGSTRKYKEMTLTAQWDRPLGNVFEIPFILTAGARYHFIPEDIPVSAALAAASATSPKGHMVVGQAKLTVPLKTGMRIPLSVTFSNRTELIKEKDVRANFGITFDLDAAFAAIKAR